MREVSNYFDCSLETVKTLFKRNKNSIFKDVPLLKGSKLKELKKNFPNAIEIKSAPSLVLFTKKQLIETGMLLYGNGIAGKMQSLVIDNEDYMNLFKHLVTFFQPLRKQRTLLQYLMLAFNQIFEVESEIKIERYRADILINNRLIIECDEHGHCHYDKELENQREDFLNRSGYKTLRYNPDSEQHDTELFQLINSIFKELKSI